MSENRTRLSATRKLPISVRMRRGGNIAFALLLYAPSAFVGTMIYEHFNPHEQAVELAVPPRPQPPGNYLALVSPEKKVAYLSQHSIQVIQVASFDQIPVPMSSLTSDFFQWFEDKNDGSKIVVVVGDIDVEIDKLDPQQDLGVLLAAKHGDAKLISIDFSEKPRGPPSREKPRPDLVSIYVIGHIRKFTGPFQTGTSRLAGAIVDLTGTDEEYSDYVSRAEGWLKAVKGLTRSYGQIPDSEIWLQPESEGKLKFHLVDGEAYPEHGPSEEKSEFDRRHAPEAGRSFSEHPVEHVIE